MTSKLSETAKKMMDEQKGHCCQAVFSTYAEQFGQGKVDFDTCMKISSAFSGGINRTGNVCGALTGALMALGLKYGGSKQEVDVTEASTKLLDEFISLHGSIICRELINHDLISDEDVKKAFETGAFKNCPKFVEDAAVLLDKHL
ncbi:MAG: C-GCAxxG-C-C family protein [Candidatus Thorarchaeota archaeon]|jgi:C_GCAxxG_C_C family probable redox protein